MIHVTVNTSGNVTFLSWSQFVFAMLWNVKGTSHLDCCKIPTIVRVCIQTKQSQGKNSHLGDVIMKWSILKRKWSQKKIGSFLWRSVWHGIMMTKSKNTYIKTSLLVWHVIKKVACTVPYGHLNRYGWCEDWCAKKLWAHFCGKMTKKEKKMFSLWNYHVYMHILE